MKLDCCTPFYISKTGGSLYHARSCPKAPNTKVTPEDSAKARHPAGSARGSNVVVEMTPELRDRLHLARNRPWGCGFDGCTVCYGTPFDDPPEVAE